MNFETRDICLTGAISACLYTYENDSKIDAAGEKGNIYRSIIPEVVRSV